jgi:hypothetical protein
MFPEMVVVAVFSSVDVFSSEQAIKKTSSTL